MHFATHARAHTHTLERHAKKDTDKHTHKRVSEIVSDARPERER